MEPLKSFRELNLPQPVLDTLEKLGFKAPTPIQALTLPAAMAGKDILGIAPTGTGKTAAYVLPAIAYLYPQPGRQILVLTPTRELATQIFRFLRQLGKDIDLKGSLLLGGESMSRQTAEMKNGADYIVATPGRLIDHLNRGLKITSVGMVVLDEVDQMLTLGFVPQVNEILTHLGKKPQTFLFSATLPPAIQKLARKYLKDSHNVNTVGSASETPKIEEEHIDTCDDEKPRLLLDQVEARPGKILVFANTQGHVEKIVRHLSDAGQSAAGLHGGRSHGERKQALDAFRRGDLRILVATDLASRGIDVVDIAHIINYDNPQKREDYLHRIGRTARLGRKGNAVTFMDVTRKRQHSAADAVKEAPKPQPKKKQARGKKKYVGKVFKRYGGSKGQGPSAEKSRSY